MMKGAPSFFFFVSIREHTSAYARIIQRMMKGAPSLFLFVADVEVSFGADVKVLRRLY